jgi:hypothetical protein
VSNLTFEPGKYKRRDGKPAWVIGKTPDGDRLLVCHAPSGDAYRHSRDGRWAAVGEREYDLIAEWKEPRKVSGTVYLVMLEYGSGIQVLCETQDYSGWAGKVNARRVIEVELTEGEGL